MDQKDEIIKEEVEIEGTLDLCRHSKRTKRKRRKTCWNCQNIGHLRSYSPYIPCFHCQRLGYLRVNCHIYRIDKLLKTIEKQQKKEREKEETKNKKAKKREEKLEISRNRAKQTTFIK